MHHHSEILTEVVDSMAVELSVPPAGLPLHLEDKQDLLGSNIHIFSHFVSV